MSTLFRKKVSVTFGANPGRFVWKPDTRSSDSIFHSFLFCWKTMTSVPLYLLAVVAESDSCDKIMQAKHV